MILSLYIIINNKYLYLKLHKNRIIEDFTLKKDTSNFFYANFVFLKIVPKYDI